MATIISGSSPSITFSDSTTQTTAFTSTPSVTTITTANDASISGLTVGKGGGAVSTNTAVGYQAGYSNTTGDQITAVGRVALYSNTTGNYNVAYGSQALYTNSTGANNTGLGFQALINNTTASNNTAVGYQAGYTQTTGGDSTYLGYTAGKSVTTAYGNLCVGAYAGRVVTTGAGNCIVGTQAGFSLTTGAKNTFIGSSDNSTNFGAGYYVTTGSSNSILGNFSGNSGGLDIRTASNYIVLSDGDGNPRVYWNGSGVMFQAVDASISGLTVGKGTNGVVYNTALGNGALAGSNSGTGRNTAIGSASLGSNTTGTYNTAIGNYDSGGGAALQSNTSGSSNTAVGNGSLNSNTTASNNTAVGYQAMYSYQTGGDNVAVGTQAGYTINGNGNATFLGRSAGYSTTGGNNTFVGYQSGYYVSTGTKNTIVGLYNGNQGGLDIRTASNYIVLSDGDGNPNFYINNYSQSFTSCSIGDFTQKWSLGTTSTDGLVVTYPTVTPNNTSRFFFRGSDSTNTKIDIYSNGTISNRTGTYNTLSDAKLKENIVDTTPKLNKLMDVKVRNYNLIGDELKQIGFVAQELEQVFPNLIDNVPDFDENREPTGEVTKGVKLTVMIPILVKAIQELKTIVDTQAAEIAELKSKVI